MISTSSSATGLGVAAGGVVGLVTAFALFVGAGDAPGLEAAFAPPVAAGDAPGFTAAFAPPAVAGVALGFAAAAGVALDADAFGFGFGVAFFCCADKGLTVKTPRRRRTVRRVGKVTSYTSHQAEMMAAARFPSEPSSSLITARPRALAPRLHLRVAPQRPGCQDLRAQAAASAERFFRSRMKSRVHPVARRALSRSEKAHPLNLELRTDQAV